MSRFAGHTNYVHPSWHELRAFHLISEPGGIRLDTTYGGMTLIAAYVVARLVVEASGAAAGFLPSDLDTSDMKERVDGTVRASRLLATEFVEFTARGGLDDDLARHAP
jgi:hypothetical protein